MAAGFVYLFQGEGGLYKIGRSTDPDRRVADFAGMPFGVTVLHRIVTDDMGWLEAFLHRLHRRKRARGEWFRLDTADVAGITAVAVCDRRDAIRMKTEAPYGRIVYKDRPEQFFDQDDYHQAILAAILDHARERALELARRARDRFGHEIALPFDSLDT